MTTTKKKMKTVWKVLLALLIVLAVIIGAFFGFILLGKDRTLNLQLEGLTAENLEDGMYTGSYSGFRWSTTVEVTVEDHQIADIQVVKDQVIAADETIAELIERVLAAQNTGVDAVTGATVDSKAFLKAVEDALSSSPAA